MRTGLRGGTCLLVAGLSVTAHGLWSAAVVADEQEGKRAAPAFELTAADGKTHRLTDYKDKIVVLEWWNQDCPVSRAYMETMKELAGKYGPRGVVWLAIDSTHYQKPENDLRYARENNIPYPILMDIDGKTGRAYGAQTTPHMFVVHKGAIVYEGAISDEGSRNYVAEALDALLAGKEVPLAKTRPFGCSVKYAPAPAADAPAAPTKAELGKPAPLFELAGTDGQTYRLADYKDRIVVLEWFNQDCPYTRRYTPIMKELATRLAGKNVVWLAIDSTHYQTAAKDAEYRQQHGLPYPILMDTDGRVGRLYAAKNTPHMFVINRGVLVYDGAIDNQGDRNYVAEAVEALLAGKEVPLARTPPFGCTVKYKER